MTSSGSHQLKKALATKVRVVETDGLRERSRQFVLLLAGEILLLGVFVDALEQFAPARLAAKIELLVAAVERHVFDDLRAQLPHHERQAQSERSAD